MPHRRFRRRLTLLVAILAALADAPTLLSAQVDVIRGRVTSQQGQPLPGVRVSATSIPGGVTREARTNAQGGYQIVFPGGPGDYMMGFAVPGYNYRQFEIKRLADEAVLVVDARLSVIQLDTVVVSAPVQQRPGRNQRTQDVSGTERAVARGELPPEQQGNIAAMAASLPGVVLVPGLEEGEADEFSVLGLGADQNNTTLNGMPVGTGTLPRDAAIGASLTTSPMDPSRGGFSGGSFDIGSRPGSNFRTRGMSLQATAPQLQWTDPAGRALGSEHSNLSLGGTLSGPIRRDKAFYNVSYELGRQSRDHRTLGSTSALGLQTAGIAPDSVARLMDILRAQQVPLAGGPARDSRLNDNGSLLGSVDFSPPSSASGQSFGLTFNGNWRRQSPVGGGTTQFASAGGERMNWGGGVQARHSGYFGLTLVETSAGLDLSRDGGDPFTDLPAGRVRVRSDFAEGAGAVQSLVFGGNQGLSSASSSLTASVRNSLSWFDPANKHRLKLSSELQYAGSEHDPSYNLLGSFTFNSLADLEAGRPASFTRTLGARERRTGVLSGAVSLGDSYRRSDDLQFQYGLRAEGGRFTTAPDRNPRVDSVFGLRNDRLPAPVSLSPRFGFSWTVGRAQEIASFAGAARRPRAVIRGGVGVFTNALGAGQLGQAMDATGLPGGTQQIVCVGPAAPVPAWEAYDDPAAIPGHCADGSSGTQFASGAPNVVLFSPDFRPQQSIRGNLSWNGAVLRGRFSLGVEGTYSLNERQQRMVDLNFDPDARFTLADEGRPVFVDPASIVPATGSTATRGARVSQAFSTVNEVRSDLRSRTAQLSLRLSPIARGRSRFGWNAAYTLSHIREQVAGFSSTAGNPLQVEWAAPTQGRHQVNYGLRYDFFGAVQVNWTGWFRSGSAFTPTVAGDVNGDGSTFNDRAFVYSPDAAPDPALAEGMRQLMEDAPAATRRCLERQAGSIAARNSCRGPWNSGASLNLTLDRVKFRMPARTSLSFSVSNPLSAADLLVNGSGNLKGWGQNAFPDASLLYVRGFDPVARRYRYEVNPRFGASNPRFQSMRAPVVVTMSMRVDLGPTRERQNIAFQLGAGRTLPGSRMPEAFLRGNGTNSVTNPMAAILREQDSLRLTAPQADSIASMNRRYTYRADSLWTPVARELAALPERFGERQAYRAWLGARRAQIEMLMDIGPAVRDLLTAEQRRKLGPDVLNLLDRRYLASIRSGTGTYVGGAPSGFAGGFSETIVSSGNTVTITRTSVGP